MRATATLLLVMLICTSVFATSIAELRHRKEILYNRFLYLVNKYAFTNNPAEQSKIAQEIEKIKKQMKKVNEEITKLQTQNYLQNQTSPQSDTSSYSYSPIFNRNKIARTYSQKLDSIAKTLNINLNPKKLSWWDKFLIRLGFKRSLSEEKLLALAEDGRIKFALKEIDKKYNSTPFEKQTTKLLLTRAKIYAIAYKNGLVSKEELAKAYEEAYKTAKFQKLHEYFFNLAEKWVEAGVVFKLGGFDSPEEFLEKKKKGYKLGLHSEEMFEKYINPKTWRFYSKKAEREFYQIGGIDCAGFVQRLWLDAFKANGIKTNIPNKKIASRILVKKYMKKLPEDGHVPPFSAKPGDMIRLENLGGTHVNWTHNFLFLGYAPDGEPLIAEASGSMDRVVIRPMPPRYYQYYAGTYRIKGAEKLFSKVTKDLDTI